MGVGAEYRDEAGEIGRKYGDTTAVKGVALLSPNGPSPINEPPPPIDEPPKPPPVNDPPPEEKPRQCGAASGITRSQAVVAIFDCERH
jgi:hypothetical protein